MKLSELSIHAWIQENNIKTESGASIDFRDHLFLFDIYRDLSPKQVILKAAQIGLTTLQILKSIWIAKNLGMTSILVLQFRSPVKRFRQELCAPRHKSLSGARTYL
jgi:hypothetical protein